MEYEELKELLKRANDAYYKEAVPIMSDQEFDIKLKELEALEKEQGYADPDSPTQKPGSDMSSPVTLNKHKRPMLSLENTYSLEEVEKWYQDMIDATGEEHPEVIVNPKYDGSSAAIRYDASGTVIKALTRGDGEFGEDITQNIQYLDANVWPSKRGYNNVPFLGEARGEIIMTKDGFSKLNKDGKYQNARNLVAGTMKLLNIYDFIERADAITFYAYWLEDSDNETYAGDLETLKSYNFQVGEYYVCHTLEEIKNAIDKIEKEDYPVAIDGAVLKLNKKIYWRAIGSTAKFPRWAKAYKYKQESVETKITNISFEIGRSGKITPLAYFEPQFIDGSTIQKATLNNKEFYDAMDIAVGDTVEVQKAAAIIPQIIRVTERPADRKRIPFPTVCPDCGSVLIKHNEEHNDWFCGNPDCPSRIVDQIINYTRALEIDGFAEVLVGRLNKAKLLNGIADLYRLKDNKGRLSEIDRLSKRLADKLCDNIENGKSADFWKLLTGLGIPNVGPKMAKTLAKYFKDMDSLQKATKLDLIMIDDIAEITANSIVEYLSNNRTKDLIEFLKKEGQNMSAAKPKEMFTAKVDLAGKTFCITGALQFPRNVYVQLIESCGGKVVSGVSGKTQYLITNDKFSGSSKNRKAQELNIPIISEKELLKMCGQENFKGE